MPSAAGLAMIGLGLLAVGARADELKLAVLGPEGAEIPGDRMTVARSFGTWTLQCDLSVSQNRRLCGVEQVLQRPGGAVLWRLARSADERNVLVFSLPLNVNRAQGLAMKLDGFATTVGPLTCQTACIAIVPLSATLQSLLLGASTVEMTYATTDGRQVVLPGTMEGFRLAVQSAAEDPFGKRVPLAPPKVAAKSAESTGSVKPKKP